MSIGAATGVFVWGPLDRLFNTRKWRLAIGIGVQLSCLTTIAAVPGLGVLVITVLFAVMGLMNGCMVMTYAPARSVFPAHLVVRGLTTLNIGTMGGAAFQQIATGYLMTWLMADRKSNRLNSSH